eukprot:scaffold86121_cov63-Phaeocystis_antarctica.AAC.3
MRTLALRSFCILSRPYTAICRDCMSSSITGVSSSIGVAMSASRSRRDAGGFAIAIEKSGWDAAADSACFSSSTADSSGFSASSASMPSSAVSLAHSCTSSAISRSIAAHVTFCAPACVVNGISPVYGIIYWATTRPKCIFKCFARHHHRPKNRPWQSALRRASMTSLS